VYRLVHTALAVSGRDDVYLLKHDIIGAITKYGEMLDMDRSNTLRRTADQLCNGQYKHALVVLSDAQSTGVTAKAVSTHFMLGVLDMSAKRFTLWDSMRRHGITEPSQVAPDVTALMSWVSAQVTRSPVDQVLMATGQQQDGHSCGRHVVAFAGRFLSGTLHGDATAMWGDAMARRFATQVLAMTLVDCHVAASAKHPGQWKDLRLFQQPDDIVAKGT